MEKEIFDFSCKAYAPSIKKIIEDNVRFYRYKDTIKWKFGFDENDLIVAACDRNTNVITINLKSVMISHNQDNLKTVEYFLLHEIRHTFQNTIINDYKNGIKVPIDKEVVEKWIYEGKHYIKSCDENGNENSGYFLQDLEMDAYAFSYAVMKYKYGNVSDLYVPNVYKDEFYELVDSWIDSFKKEQL